MTNKKILLINWRDIKNPEAGGAELYFHEIFRRLNENGFDVTVLAHRVKGLPDEETIDGMRTVRIGNKFLFNYSAFFYAKKHEKDYDLIVEDLNKIPFFTPLGTKTKRLHMVMHFFRKSIFRETVFPIALYVYLMERAVALFYRGENFLAISESTKDEIIDMGIRAKKISIVEPGIDTEFFYPTLPKATPPVISYIGRLMKYKNAQFAIQAMPRLKELVPGIVLEIAGSGDYRAELEKLAREKGVGDSVKFLGRISEEAKRDLLSRSSLFINPSFKEGWGINNIEANLCGTISMSNNVAGLKDSVIDGETGILYENSDPESFCKKVANILHDKKLLGTLEENARRRALGMSWDAMAEKMRHVIDEILAPKETPVS